MTRDAAHASKRPVALVIMDGLAYGAPTASLEGDAVRQADTPILDDLTARWPHARLDASGLAVGLPEGQMGNSEVGHLNIGAGRTVYQELTRIDLAIADGSLRENAVLLEAIDGAVHSGGSVHLMGLVSDGGVHSSIQHLYALIELAASRGAQQILIHAFLDGRDTPPTSGSGYLGDLEVRCAELGAGRIATVMGRYYAMDRDQRWERTERAWQCLVEGQAAPAQDAVGAVRDSYAQGITDEFMLPRAIGYDGMTDGDAVIFFNFRPDRARQITRALVDPVFTGFTRARSPQLRFVCLTQYDPEIPAPVAFPKELIADTLADVVSAAGLSQLHIAETEKYAHVTFFLNGGREVPVLGEQRTLVPSPKVATYDVQPEMSAPAVGDALVAAIERGDADFYVVNFANGDMVGHTGNIPATIQAVQAVDTQVGRIVRAITERGGAAIITADHGNAEEMLDASGVRTAHSLHSVPVIVVNSEANSVRSGTLADVAPTVLDIMGLDAPASWTGKSLVLY